MKNKSITALFLVFFIMACESDQNAPDFQLGEPSIAGSGCSESSVELNDEGQRVFVHFNEFQVEAGGLNPSLQRKNCTLATPLDVPSGFQVAIIPGIVTGSADIKTRTSLKINLTSFLAGKKGFTNSFTAEEAGLQTFAFGRTFDLRKVEFSECGESVIIRVNMSLLLKSKNKEDPSLATINKFGGENQEAFSLIWKKCQS